MTRPVAEQSASDAYRESLDAALQEAALAGARKHLYRNGYGDTFSRDLDSQIDRLITVAARRVNSDSRAVAELRSRLRPKVEPLEPQPITADEVLRIAEASQDRAEHWESILRERIRVTDERFSSIQSRIDSKAVLVDDLGRRLGGLDTIERRTAQLENRQRWLALAICVLAFGVLFHIAMH